jgi:hypothetical protein
LRLGWLLRGRAPPGVAISEDGGALLFEGPKGRRAMGCLAITPPEEEQPSIRAHRVQLSHLLEALRRAQVPFLYQLLVEPSEDGFVSCHLVAATWGDGSSSEASLKQLEERMKVLQAALGVALPGAALSRLRGAKLLRLISFFWREAPPQRRAPLKSVAPFISLPSAGAWQGAVSVPQFYVPGKEEAGDEGDVLVGRAVVDGQPTRPVYVKREELTRHLVLLGATGSGKSFAAAHLLLQAYRKGVPFLVLDWHNEYSPLVRALGGLVIRPGEQPLFNPLEPVVRRAVSDHVDLITDIFSDVYRFTSPQAYLFRSTLEDLLTTSPDEITLSNLIEAIGSRPLHSSYDNETKMALLRRLTPLTRGLAGNALDRRGAPRADVLLDRPCCVELGHLKELELRSIIASLVLKLVYDLRTSQGPSPLKHLVALEEARFLVPPRRPEDPPSIVEKMVGELRKFGEGVLLVAQFPTQLAGEVVKNAGIKLVFRMTWLEDLRLVRDALGLSEEQARYLPHLQAGEALLYSGRFREPVLVRIEDEELAQLLPQPPGAQAKDALGP